MSKLKNKIQKLIKKVIKEQSAADKPFGMYCFGYFLAILFVISPL